MQKFSLAEETLGYNTSSDPANSDKRLLIAGSKNVLVDVQKKVKSRPGYTRLGPANAAQTGMRNAWTWHTSTGTYLSQRFYDQYLEVYLSTIDGTAINAWTQIKSGFSTTGKLRPATWYDTTEKIDLELMVQNDSSIFEWNGAIAVVDTITATTITKRGTNTFAQNRFYTTRNKNVVCVRTGTVYTYTGGESTLTLSGISSTAGLVSGDVLVQQVVSQANTPGATRTNTIPYVFENQLVLGSSVDESVYVSKTTSYIDFTFSSPRAPGEGAVLTAEGQTVGIASLGSSLLVFTGRSTILEAIYNQITVNSTVAETLKFKKLDVGIDQGALSHETIVPIGDSLAYLTNEVTLRIIQSLNNLTGLDPKSFSYPIKPDFDAETWTDAFGIWYKNILIYTAPATSHMYMLNFIQDADGKLLRFWNPPQTLPVGALSTIDTTGAGQVLYGHSYTVPESYLLFDGLSDGQTSDGDPANKLPIDARAVFAYDNAKNRALLKCFDEYYVDGEITANTIDLLVTFYYDFGGSTQILTKTIDGSDQTILRGLVNSHSLAQQSLGQNPLGGLLSPPTSARRFGEIMEMAKEDYFEMTTMFSTNDIDRYWAITSRGSNEALSPRRPTHIKK